MATATNTTEGQILLSGDLTGTGENPELRASGVVPRAYNTTLGVPNSTGASLGTVPKMVIDSKGRVVYASAVYGNLQFQVANSTTNGLVKVDGTTVTASGGVLSSIVSNPPVATSSVNGAIKGGGGITTGITFDDPGEPNYPMFATARMRTDRRGRWAPDRTTISIDNNGIASAIRAKATSSTIGVVKPDNTTIQIDGNGIIRANLNLATTSVNGAVKVDGVSIGVNGSGVLSALADTPLATFASLGTVKPDNATISIDGAGTINFNKASSSAKGIITAPEGDFVITEVPYVFSILALALDYSASSLAWKKANNFARDYIPIGMGANNIQVSTNYIHLHLTANSATVTSLIAPSGFDLIGSEFIISITKDAGVASSTSISSIFTGSNFKVDIINASFSLSSTIFAKMIVVSNGAGGYLGLLYNTQSA